MRGKPKLADRYRDFDMTLSEQFDTELFILEIEERPALWNSALKEHSDKNVRKAMWEEIVHKFGGEELV